MFLFSGQGLLTIVVIALLLFGPEKLPEMARLFGRFRAEFKRAQDAVEATMRAEMYQSNGGSVPTGGGAAAASAAAALSHASTDEDDDEEEDEE
jgi:TatA/E family protein of Tat protein translocase